MGSGTPPLVSVVTVNFNGERYLRGLLSSLAQQTYPRIEILLVDNGSTDGSIPLVEREFPDTRVVHAGRNLGFAGGNNLGIRKARGAYVALINNDTLPDADWLLRLVETAQTSDRIGAVGSKILFARPFLPLALEVAQQADDTDDEPGTPRVFVSERSGFEDCSYGKRVFAAGFSTPERHDSDTGCWSDGRSVLYLPVESLSRPGDVVLRTHAEQAGPPCRLKASIGGLAIGEAEVASGWIDWRLPVDPAIACRHGFDLINNAASFLEPDGAAGDRGIFEPDRGQFDAVEDVTSLCGCSMLLSRTAIEVAGAFDEDFFMYFEDTELSWRLRKTGYRLVYQPESVVRHFHASTSVEWSPLFNFLVARNRILMLLKHAPLRHALRAYAEELARLWKLALGHRSLRHVDVRTRIKIQLSLLGKAPRAFLKRWGLITQ